MTKLDMLKEMHYALRKSLVEYTFSDVTELVNSYFKILKKAIAEGISFGDEIDSLVNETTKTLKWCRDNNKYYGFTISESVGECRNKLEKLEMELDFACLKLA